MKTYTLPAFLLVFYFCCAFYRPTSTILLNGKIEWRGKGNVHLQKLTLRLKADGREIASSAVDSANRYHLMYTDMQEKVFEFYLADESDTLLMLVDSNLVYFDEFAERNFVLPKKYVLEDGKATCPKCGKRDQVAEIVYGDGIPSEYDSDGNIKKIGAGCIVNIISPHWYCRRDKVRY